MELILVESSMISAVGYAADTQQLFVIFNSGKAYTYERVPQDIFDGLLAASSKGSYMRAFVIDMFPYSIGIKSKKK